MEELNKLLKGLGYTEYDINEIINTYSVSNMKKETLMKNVKRNYAFLIELGYSQEEVIKITKNCPAIFLCSIENISQKIENIKQLGYSQEEVIKITKALPAIFNLSIENMKQKIEDMKQLGYSQEELIKITKNHPAIFSYNIENMKQKIEDIKQLGYSQEEVIRMTKALPTIFGLSIENLKQKIEFYDYIGLHSLAIMSPSYLMQSTALSYARYMFLKEKGIRIDETNYNKLFYNQKLFQNQYGITKEELLAKYDFKKYLEEKNTLGLVTEAQETIEENISYIDDTEQVMTKQESAIEKQENSQEKE